MGDWGEGAKGAAGGAAAGTAILPGWGTAIGAAVGGIAGYLGGGGDDEHQAMLKRLAAGYQNRVAPQRGAANLAAQSGLVGNRASLISQLEAQSRGEGPSAARLQMQQAADQTTQMLASQAAGAGGRGVNAGAAMRNASNAGQQVMQRNNQDMGIMRAQEQMNATSQLGQVVGQGINADHQFNQWNAGARNDVDSQNMQAQMHMLQLNDQSQLAALGMHVPSVGLGTQIMTGGATAAPYLTQAFSQQPQGYGGAIGPQQGQAGWDSSSMGQYQEQQRQQWMRNNTPQAPQQSAPAIDPNTWGGNHPWSNGNGR